MRERIMARQVNLGGARRRCDLKDCKNGPVAFGYLIKEGPCQGFFCGPRHYHVARTVMEEMQEQLNLQPS